MSTNNMKVVEIQNNTCPFCKFNAKSLAGLDKHMNVHRKGK